MLISHWRNLLCSPNRSAMVFWIGFKPGTFWSIDHQFYQLEPSRHRKIHWLFSSFAEPEVREALALHDFEGRSGRELSFRKGETLVLYTQASHDWWEGCCNGKEGLIPDKYIQVKPMPWVGLRSWLRMWEKRKLMWRCPVMGGHDHGVSYNII